MSNETTWWRGNLAGGGVVRLDLASITLLAVIYDDSKVGAEFRILPKHAETPMIVRLEPPEADDLIKTFDEYTGLPPAPTVDWKSEAS